MKERVAQILGGTALTEEQKRELTERPIEPFVTWKMSRMRNGYGINESSHSPSNGKQVNSDSLTKIMEKYSLVKDNIGIRRGKYIENWKEFVLFIAV